MEYKQNTNKNFHFKSCVNIKIHLHVKEYLHVCTNTISLYYIHSLSNINGINPHYRVPRRELKAVGSIVAYKLHTCFLAVWFKKNIKSNLWGK